MSTIQSSPFSLIEQAVEQQNVEALFAISHEEVSREDLDRIEVTEQNSEMVQAAKFVWSLRKVQQLEANGIDHFILENIPQIQKANPQLAQVLMKQMHPLKEFKHLITVPNRNALLANVPNLQFQQIYQHAFADAEAILNQELLERIYTAAWSNVNLPNTQFNLAIMEPHSDIHGLPNAAIAGLCKGLIQRHEVIEGIVLPISVDDHQLQQLCETIHGRHVNTLCLSLKQDVSEASLAKLMETIVSTRATAVALNGIPATYHATAQVTAAANNIQLTLGQAYWQR